jgi:hypothetical protein
MLVVRKSHAVQAETGVHTRHATKSSAALDCRVALTTCQTAGTMSHQKAISSRLQTPTVPQHVLLPKTAPRCQAAHPTAITPTQARIDCGAANASSSRQQHLRQLAPVSRKNARNTTHTTHTVHKQQTPQHLTAPCQPPQRQNPCQPACRIQTRLHTASLLTAAALFLH